MKISFDVSIACGHLFILLCPFRFESEEKENIEKTKVYISKCYMCGKCHQIL